MNELGIILDIVLIILALYLAFFKSYFQEKGKNLATKEDIKDITETVETVKNQLHFDTQSKLSLKNEERKVLVEGFAKYIFWFNSIMDVKFGAVTEENESKLTLISTRLNEAEFDYGLSESSMALYINNNDLMKVLGDLRIKTLEMQHRTEKSIGELSYNVFEVKRMRASTSLEEQPEKYQELLNKQAGIIQTYREEKIEMFKELLPLKKLFQTIAYAHIQGLLNEENEGT